MTVQVANHDDEAKTWAVPSVTSRVDAEPDRFQGGPDDPSPSFFIDADRWWDEVGIPSAFTGTT